MSVEVTESTIESPESSDAHLQTVETGPSVEHGAEAPTATAEQGVGQRPKFVFLGAVSALALILDVLSKAWAEIELSKRIAGDPTIVMVDNHLGFTLAYNQGGAWGLLQTASETIRRPFFLVVSVVAIVFIVSLYNRLLPAQRALKWGLPMVLGGALGNLADRVVRGSVVDFIDYRADWVRGMNELIAKLSSTWHITDHWPTFNVADICICIGVGLMAVDMFTGKRQTPEEQPASRSLPREHQASDEKSIDAEPLGG